MAKARSKRGFAAMDDEKRREIARKGGEAVSQDREHMAEIGRKGGEVSRIRPANANRDVNDQNTRSRQDISSGGSSNDQTGG